jgi:hypothetical protein
MKQRFRRPPVQIWNQRAKRPVGAPAGMLGQRYGFAGGNVRVRLLNGSAPLSPIDPSSIVNESPTKNPLFREGLKLKTV